MRFRVIENIDDYYWKQVWDIYNSNFQGYQKRSLEMQIEAMKNEDFNCLAVLEKKRVIGIVFYWDLESIRYIEHIAWNLNLKGTGYEKRIISKLCEDKIPMIIEFEKKVDDSSLERFSNYEELGFKRNIFEHKRPCYNKEHNDKSLIVLSYPSNLIFEDYLYFDNILINEIMNYRDV